MADNVEITPGAGATIASDDVGGVQYQRIKVAFGTDGAAVDVSAANPWPVAPNVTRGVGVADANTQRVTLASDGPAVTALTSMDAKTPSLINGATPTIETTGELIEAIESLRMAIGALTRGVGLLTVDTAARLRATIETFGAATTLPTVTTVTGVTTVSTLTNQSQIGGFAGNDQIPALMHMVADGIRANILVT